MNKIKINLQLIYKSINVLNPKNIGYRNAFYYKINSECFYAVEEEVNSNI